MRYRRSREYCLTTFVRGLGDRSWLQTPITKDVNLVVWFQGTRDYGIYNSSVTMNAIHISPYAFRIVMDFFNFQDF